MSEGDGLTPVGAHYAGDRLRRRSAANDWAGDEVAAEDRPGAGYDAGSFITLGFLGAALRRSVRLWLAVTALGFVVGSGLYVKLPAAYQATTTIYLTNNPAAPAGTAIVNAQAIADSPPVAADALRRLGLKESAASFISKYTVVADTDRVLLITAKATSGQEAVREANAVAAAFLAFDAHLIESQTQLINRTLQQQIAQAQNNLAALNRQISSVAAQPVTPAQTAQLQSLRSQQARASGALTTLTQAVAADEASTQIDNTAQIKGSQVLNTATPVRQSRKRRLLLYAGGGLLAGLVIGTGIVVVGAVVSDKLRRRDDVALALKAPVWLSVSYMSPARRFGVGRNKISGRADTQRVVAHLSKLAYPAEDALATLAIVPVDDALFAARSLASLAVNRAEKGLRVVVADLCRGAPVAQLLGDSSPGIRRVSTEGARLVVWVPAVDDPMPLGPLGGSRRVRTSHPLASACESADLLLTLAPLDPANGGEYLAGWATGVVAFVTSGRSSATRVYAVGEMVRSAGIAQLSAVLLGADKSDESVGLASALDAVPGARIMNWADGADLVASMDVSAHQPEANDVAF